MLEGADLFIGLSGGRVIEPSALAAMNPDPIVFAMANPDPEVSPEEAAAAYARVVATGRSDYPNQINNVLCFPGIFRGALDVRATQITEEMKMAAARAIADIVSTEELREDYIIPSVFNREVVGAVAERGGRRGAGERHGRGGLRDGVRVDRRVRGAAGAVGVAARLLDARRGRLARGRRACQRFAFRRAAARSAGDGPPVARLGIPARSEDALACRSPFCAAPLR